MPQRHPPTTAHNYLEKELELLGDIAPGTVSDVDVRHDAWCDALRGKGFCNCDPDVTLRRSN